MVYRAKCTKIISFIESHYNNTIVSDKKDKYVEVNTLDEAELIEEMNKLETRKSEIIIKLLSMREV